MRWCKSHDILCREGESCLIPCGGRSLLLSKVVGGVPHNPRGWEESHFIPCSGDESHIIPCNGWRSSILSHVVMGESPIIPSGGRSPILSHVAVGGVPYYPMLLWGKFHLIPSCGGGSPILSHVVVGQVLFYPMLWWMSSSYPM